MGCLLRGNYLEVAASRAGVSTTTLNNWRRDGERALEKAESRRSAHEKRLADFALGCQKAEADFEIGVLKKIESEGDPKVLLELLARRFPKRWGQSQRIDHTSSDKSMTPAGAVGVVILPAMVADDDGAGSAESSERTDGSEGEGHLEPEQGTSD